MTSRESGRCRAYGLLLTFAVLGLVAKIFVPCNDGVDGKDLGSKYASFPSPPCVLLWLVRRCWPLFRLFETVISGAAVAV